MANVSWPQRAALALGVLLVVWGLVDFAAGRAPLALLHVITGGFVLGAAFKARSARFAGTFTSLVLLVAFAYGLGDAGGPLDAGFASNAAHLLLGFASIGIAESCAWCEKRARGTAVRPVRRG